MQEKIITIPNIITLFRFLLIPFYILFLVHNKPEIAVLLFAAITISDVLDGLSARITKQKTRIGALFDSITDWVLLLSTLVALIFIRKYVTLNIIVVLIIPTIMGLILKVIYIRKKKNFSPTIIGKITFGFAYITVVAFLINFTYKGIFLITITILAYITMTTWIVRDVKIFIR